MAAVGESTGSEVAVSVGSTMGVLDGSVVGTLVGTPVGSPVGLLVASSVGSIVAAAVGVFLAVVVSVGVARTPPPTPPLVGGVGVTRGDTGAATGVDAPTLAVGIAALTLIAPVPNTTALNIKVTTNAQLMTLLRLLRRKLLVSAGFIL